MSNSYRKAPVIGRCSVSEKQCKRRANRRLRRGNNAQPEREPKLMREKNNMWDFAKDGKSRFDPKKYPEAMRK